ncbi:vesicle-associated membrane protein [Encephalitozoon intestinalis ATCC 50506]|uniref:Vesicle-associated membrane protein n=1 Tax=Encephalitozoon intestinalis (strain ATCC 50506) TaxID=876142 RepID=E0SAC6_ENCIT|nr:vesicle-associated membrane protein [Encephalitozoon intestinalis ATCC 50506]ADM12551.1 vesicle-associated membrane protein [Encephalitozoon intestinalis ATCC 50506]UTX46407.1 vesicle-associated membrane protein [Encephalitozoon intestinalis]
MLDIKVTPQTTIRVKRNKKSSTFIVHNNSMESVGYKIKTTKPRDYIVRPNMGLIVPMQHAEIEVTLSETTVPDNTHKFLIEIYKFDWRRSLNDFKHYLKSVSPKPCWTSRIGILYEEEEKITKETVECSEDRGAIVLFVHIYILCNVLYLFYRFFE